MTFTFLGTGTSSGVPALGCHCEVCTSTDSRDKRLRCAAVVEAANTRLLIDCGPDIRQQLLSLPFKPFDGVLLTHIHYDHVGGIDDLRPFCALSEIDIYSDSRTVEGLRHTMPYCFTAKLYPGVPRLNLHEVSAGEMFRVKNLDIMPIEVKHGALPILGYRIGKLAYLTDVKTIEESQVKNLYGVEMLIVSALRYGPEHYSHGLVKDAITLSDRVGAKETYFIHMCHEIGKHADVEAQLPQHIHLAYDGLKLQI